MKTITKNSLFFLILFSSLCFHYDAGGQPVNANNPMYFTQIYARTVNGLSPISIASNITYIDDKTDLIFHFVGDSIHDKVIIKISAEVVDGQGKKKPISIPGYATVVQDTGKTTTTEQTGATNVETNELRYTITYNAKTSIKIGGVTINDIVDAEIPLSQEKLKSGDQVVVRVNNTQFGTTYTKTFEVQDFGWVTNISASVVWIKTYSSNEVNFQTSTAATYEISYKFSPDYSFFYKLLVPGFGPQVSILDINQAKTLGFGAFVSFLNRTLQIGTGVFLNKNGNVRDKEYYYLGVNFIEGIAAFK